MYEGEDYDLAGFCVGIVEKAEMIDGSAVAAGDSLIGLTSSGPHSNGFSLIRKVIEISQTDPSQLRLSGERLIDLLMEPTKIYVKSLLKLISQQPVHALAHITGGGLLENIPRVLPDDTKAIIDCNAWQRPEVFDWLQQTGNIDEREMHRTLNCGIGMVVCVPAADTQAALDSLRASVNSATARRVEAERMPPSKSNCSDYQRDPRHHKRSGENQNCGIDLWQWLQSASLYRRSRQPATGRRLSRCYQ